MAFTVETGSVVAGANSLCSVEYADSYFAERGVAAWTGSTSLKQAALIRATDYIETRWGPRFKGAKSVDTQPLSFPRLGINADDEVPLRVQKACAEYALRTISGTALATDPTVDASGRAVKRVKEKLDGVAETETEFFTPTVAFQSYPAADSLLATLVRSGTTVYR